jgi:hypothetical protein
VDNVNYNKWKKNIDQVYNIVQSSDNIEIIDEKRISIPW